MKSQISYPVKVFATGFVVLTLLSTPLFWFRFLCERILVSRMPLEVRYVSIIPSGLVPPELENDPNVIIHSRVSARMKTEETAFLGIIDYFQARSPGERHSNIYYYNKKDEDWTYFDERIGLIIHRETMHDKNRRLKKMQLYVGPEGILETAEKSLGRFITPITDSTSWGWPLRTVYDKKLRRFFTIDFDKRTVVKGPQLGKDDPHKPVQIGRLSKNPSFVQLHWSAPHIKVPDEEIERSPFKPTTKPMPGTDYGRGAGPYLLVLDETGRIDLLDRQTLEFAGTAGFLPRAQFSSTESATDADLLGYQAFALTSTTDKKYRGMCVASVCREGTALTLAVYDGEGKLVRRDYSKDTKRDRWRNTQTIPSSRAVFFEVPWAPALTIAKYLTENLHPPLLSLVSYFTASSFEATAGHRALFVLPNSFAAMKGRDISENIGTRFYATLLMILPSIILAILLAWRVSKDATDVGLSEKAKLYWMLGTLAFGLTAYITYRLTRPKITLVTCANCGRLRRPDMARCHRCGSKWHVPELTPPTWRVVDS